MKTLSVMLLTTVIAILLWRNTSFLEQISVSDHVADDSYFVASMTWNQTSKAADTKETHAETLQHQNNQSASIPTLDNQTGNSTVQLTRHHHPVNNSPVNCGSYQGVLLITHLGEAEGTGTAFFNLVVDQLLYAEQYNLQPVLLPNNLSVPCYDSMEHESLQTTVTFPSRGEATPIKGQGDMECRVLVEGKKHFYPYPGPPHWSSSAPVTVTGNTLWTSYFEPLEAACTSLPAINLQSYIETPGLHKCAPFSVRSWDFRGLPTALTPYNTTLHQWFYPMRQRASRIVQKYFALKPSIQQLVDQVNPSSSNNSSCLALHIRATDKGNGRRLIPLQKFRRYVEAYASTAPPDAHIYLATDDASVVQLVQQWTTSDKDRTTTVRYQRDAIRSTTSEPTFALNKSQTHRTNIEALVDIYALSKCRYFVHGFSAMAESVMYLNLGLHHRSFNLDDDNKMDLKGLKRMVRRYSRQQERLMQQQNQTQKVS